MAAPPVITVGAEAHHQKETKDLFIGYSVSSHAFWYHAHLTNILGYLLMVNSITIWSTVSIPKRRQNLAKPVVAHDISMCCTCIVNDPMEVDVLASTMPNM